VKALSRKLTLVVAAFWAGTGLADLLHPSERGYQIWAEAMQDPLARMMK